MKYVAYYDNHETAQALKAWSKNKGYSAKDDKGKRHRVPKPIPAACGTFTTKADYQTARAKAASARTDKGLKLRVLYYNLDTDEGLHMSCLQVVKRKTANMIIREGGKLQNDLWLQARIKEDVKYDSQGAYIEDLTHVFDGLAIEDMLQHAALAYASANKMNLTRLHAEALAFRMLGTYLDGERAINLTKHDMRTTYIPKGGDDNDDCYYDVNSEIHKLVKKGGGIYWTDEPNDAEHVKRTQQVNFIVELMKRLTAKQKMVLDLWACGRSERDIADTLHISKTTVNDHKRLITNKALKLNSEIRNGYTD